MDIREGIEKKGERKIEREIEIEKEKVKTL